MTRPALKIIDCEGVRQDDDDMLLMELATDNSWTWSDIARHFGAPIERLKARYASLHDQYWMSEAAG